MKLRFVGPNAICECFVDFAFIFKKFFNDLFNTFRSIYL